MLAENTHDKYRKYGKNSKSNINQDLGREEAKKGPEMSVNIAKVTRIFKLAKNAPDKYSKNRKNNKCNKIPDLESKEVKKGPEMSPNIAKIAKVTRMFHAS